MLWISCPRCVSLAANTVCFSASFTAEQFKIFTSMFFIGCNLLYDCFEQKQIVKTVGNLFVPNCHIKLLRTRDTQILKSYNVLCKHTGKRFFLRGMLELCRRFKGRKAFRRVRGVFTPLLQKNLAAALYLFVKDSF